MGSVRSAKLRMAHATSEHKNAFRTFEEKHEIVSLVGSLSKSGGHHLHASLSDKDGNVYGGHVMEMDVFTTAEIVLGVTETQIFDRVFDEDTGFKIQLGFPPYYKHTRTQFVCFF